MEEVDIVGVVCLQVCTVFDHKRADELQRWVRWSKILVCEIGMAPNSSDLKYVVFQ